MSNNAVVRANSQIPIQNAISNLGISNDEFVNLYSVVTEVRLHKEEARFLAILEDLYAQLDKNKQIFTDAVAKECKSVYSKLKVKVTKDERKIKDIGYNLSLNVTVSQDDEKLLVGYSASTPGTKGRYGSTISIGEQKVDFSPKLRAKLDVVKNLEAKVLDARKILVKIKQKLSDIPNMERESKAAITMQKMGDTADSKEFVDNIRTTVDLQVSDIVKSWE